MKRWILLFGLVSLSVVAYLHSWGVNKAHSIISPDSSSKRIDSLSVPNQLKSKSLNEHADTVSASGNMNSTESNAKKTTVSKALPMDNFSNEELLPRKIFTVKSRRFVEGSEASDSKTPGASVSQKMASKNRKYLNEIESLLRQAEIRRTQFEVKEHGDVSYARAVITRPEAAELLFFEEKIQSYCDSVEPEFRPFLFVDAQRMLDRYCDFKARYVVLIVSMVQPNSNTLAVGSHAVYWDFHTDSPSEYYVTSNGEVHDPTLDKNEFIIPRQWFNLMKPNTRYAHLFQAF